MLFGRDEEALQQLGQEVGTYSGSGGGGGSLADFLRSYAAGAAAAADEEDDAERGALMFEDRRGAGAAEAAAGEQQQQGQPRRRQAVWEDPQDAHIRVNVAAKGRLRKLRHAEDEAELTGGGLWALGAALLAWSGHSRRSGPRPVAASSPCALPAPPAPRCRPAVRGAAAPAAQQAQPPHRLGQPEEGVAAAAARG